MKKKKYLGLFSFICFCLFGFSQKYVQADTKMNTNPVMIDGQFNDWSPSAMNSVYKDGEYKFSFKEDGTNLYIYVSMKAYDRFRELRWMVQSENHEAALTIKPNGTIYSLQPGQRLEANAWLHYSASDNDIFIGNNASKEIAGSTGFVSTTLGPNNAYSDQAEVKIPLSGIFKHPQAITHFTLKLSDGIGDVSYEITKTDNKPTPDSTSDTTTNTTNATTNSSSSEQPVTPVQPSDNGGNPGKGGPIVIDGSYDDWSGKPLKDLYEPWEKPTKDQKYGTVTKQMSAVSDGEYLYLYVDMNPYQLIHDYRFQGNSWKIQIGKDSANLYLLPQTQGNPGNPDWERLKGIQPGQKEPIVAWLNTSETNAGIIQPSKPWGQQEVKGSQGIVTTEKFHTNQDNRDHYRDRMEIKIPLSGIVKDPKIVKEISISNHELGDQVIEVTGGSTGSTLIVLSGVAIAGGVVYRQLKKKKEFSK